jgi:hypothetical protein
MVIAIFQLARANAFRVDALFMGLLLNWSE